MRAALAILAFALAGSACAQRPSDEREQPSPSTEATQGRAQGGTEAAPITCDLATIDQARRVAVERLAALVPENGQALTYMCRDRAMQDCRGFRSVFAVALALEALVEATPVVDAAAKRELLAAEIVALGSAQGVWSHGVNPVSGEEFSPDIDDTAVARIALARSGGRPTEDDSFVSMTRTRGGLHHTWIRERNALNDTDCAANANLLRYLQHRNLPAAGIERALSGLVVADGWRTCAPWYVSPTWFVHFLARTAPDTWMDAMTRTALNERVSELVEERATDGLEEALVAATAARVLPDDAAALAPACRLAQKIAAAGPAERVAAFRGPSGCDESTCSWFGSEFLTAAIELDALNAAATRLASAQTPPAVRPPE